LDILISQVDPLYLRSLQRYQRVLFQRNQLLKTLRDGRASPEEMAFWDTELVKEGASIVLRRLEAMDALTPLAQGTHQQLTTGAEALRMEYACSVRTSQRDGVAVALAEALQAGKGREVAAGATLVGPHRDDLRLLIGGVEAGAYASRGQARTAGLSLRLAEAAYLAACKGEAPVLLLDDVLSELDASRRRHVLERAAAHDQALITTTDLSPIATPFLDHAAKLKVEGGAVYPGPSS
ncbi:MAG: DNA replication and repair protein RecF, partial [Chloroflexota bacterium]|nr:DNA replication and repair protein RecF [Chloroflexota bacterium]